MGYKRCSNRIFSRFSYRKYPFYRKIRFLGKCFNFPLPLHDKTNCNGLHTSCRQPPFGHFLPQQRGKFIPHKTVQHPSGLLGINKSGVDFPGMGKRIFYCRFGNFMKGNAGNRNTFFLIDSFLLKNLCNMPGNGFPFTIRIGSQDNAICIFCGCHKLRDALFLLSRNNIFRHKGMPCINTQR